MPKGSHTTTGFRRVSPFASRSFRRVPGEGPRGKVQCMLVGERPGEEEARRGKPFCGPAGKYLDICLGAAAIDRSQLWVTNLVKDFRGYHKPTVEELARDHSELVGEIFDHEPDVIGMVGGWSVEEILGVEKAGMDRVHGVPRRITHLFGGEIEYECVVMAILHPSQANYSPDSLPLILDDFLALGKLLDGELEIVSDPYAGVGMIDYRVVSAGELDDILG